MLLEYVPNGFAFDRGRVVQTGRSVRLRILLVRFLQRLRPRLQERGLVLLEKIVQNAARQQDLRHEVNVYLSGEKIDQTSITKRFPL